MSDDPRVTVPRDEWERLKNHARFSFHLTETLGEPKQATIFRDGAPIFMGRDFSADLAAERPDEGEGQQIRCPSCGIARGWNEDGHLTRGIWTLNCVECGSFQIEIEDDPAPVSEPLCRCGHAKLEHWDGRLQCFDGLLGHCAEYTPAPPPVPVSDEAVADQDNGQANTCRHLSASGMDTSSGPGKVWRCDHCGLCWIEGYSPHGFRAGRGEAKP